VPLTPLGGTLSGPVVYQDNALEYRTDERCHPDATHREPLLNWFRVKGQLFSGVVEGFNHKAKLTSGKFGSSAELVGRHSA